MCFVFQRDEAGINPLIKVWDTSRYDKNGMPYCHRITRAIPGNRPVNASALCVQESLQLMAVGFVDGSLLLYRYFTALLSAKIYKNALFKFKG